MRSKFSGATSDYQESSYAILALLAELTEDELERVASVVIRDYRSRMRGAQVLFEEISQLESSGTVETLACRRHDYRVAMLNVHAQHQLISLVINCLGHVPEVDGQQQTHN